MSLYDDIQKKYIEAKKARNKFEENILNLLYSDLKYEKINKQKEVEDKDVIAIIKKEIKLKNENIESCKASGRNDMIEEIKKEIAFLESLLPPMLGDNEIREIINKVKIELNINDPKDSGKLIKEVINRCEGRAEATKIKDLIAESFKK